MSAIPTQLPQGVRTSEPVFSISVERYHEMIERGILTSDDPVELLEGVLVFRMPQDEPHNVAVDLLDDQVSAAAPEGWCYRNQCSLTLADGEPEPDGVLVRGDRRHYLREGRKPGGGDAAIVFEVSDSTLARDRSIKLRSYARAGIPVYWIVNLIDRVVEVYTDPDPKADPEPTYRNVTTFKPGDAVPVSVAGENARTILVNGILP